MVVVPNAPGSGNPPAAGGAGLPFCGFNPAWASEPILLQGRFNKDYGGIVLLGRVLDVDMATGSTCSFRPPGRRRRASVRPAFTSSVRQLWVSLGPSPRRVVQWLGPDSTEHGPEARAGAVVEIAVCRCGKDHEHQPPSGKSGCGFWTYVHLEKGTIPGGE